MALADVLRERISRRGRTAEVACGLLGTVTVEALPPRECAALGMRDGGRALLLILAGFLPHDTAAAGVRACSLALGAGLLAGGISLLTQGGGATLAIMGCWLLLCQFRERKMGK